MTEKTDVLDILKLLQNRLPDITVRHIDQSLQRLNSVERWMIFDGKRIEDDGIAYLNRKLDKRAASLARSLSLTQCDLTDACIDNLASIVKRCKNLKELTLSNNDITAAGFERLSKTLLDHPSLRHLSISMNPLGPDAAPAIAQIMAMPNLWELKADSVKLGDEGMSTVAEALRTSPAITSLFLTDNNGGEKAAAAFASAIDGNRTLTNIHLSQKNTAANATIQQALMNSPSLNLITAHPGGSGLYNRLQINKDAAQHAANLLRKEPEDLSFRDHAAISLRDRAAYSQYVFGPTHKSLDEAIERYDAFLAQMPALPAQDEKFTEGLFTANEHGYAPLDNPRNWRDNPELLDTIRQTGAKLDKSLLARRTPNGISLLESAIATQPVDSFISAVNEKGIQLGKKELLTKAGEPSELLQTILERGEVKSLFTVKNWYGQPKNELRQVAEALPADIRQGLSLFALETKITPRKSSQGIGR